MEACKMDIINHEEGDALSFKHMIPLNVALVTCNRSTATEAARQYVEALKGNAGIPAI